MEEAAKEAGKGSGVSEKEEEAYLYNEDGKKDKEEAEPFQNIDVRL